MAATYTGMILAMFRPPPTDPGRNQENRKKKKCEISFHLAVLAIAPPKEAGASCRPFSLPRTVRIKEAAARISRTITAGRASQLNP